MPDRGRWNGYEALLMNRVLPNPLNVSILPPLYGEKLDLMVKLSGFQV